MKPLLWFLRLSLIVLSILWTFGAVKAGFFVRDAQVFASRVDEDSIEPFSRDKNFVDIGAWRVAYIDRGSGEPIVLLHGCPFQSFEYSKVIHTLARHYRVIAPDLLGLGDTIVRLDDDYRLPNQVRMVVGLLDRLGIRRAHFVGHDHGGAIVPLMMNSHADRLGGVERDNRATPARLGDSDALDRSAAVRTRQFVFFVRPSFGPLPSPSWRINGQRFDSETPIASPRYGDVEIWRFVNKSFLGVLGIVHPVHVHLATFKVLQRNGGPPLPHEAGWKDTVAVDRDEDVSVIAKFDGYRGRYLLHCHNLEHEDHSMMARFDVA